MSIRAGASRLYNGQTEIRFIPRWKLWFALSAAVILVGFLGLLGRGLNLGIDFEGGVSWEAPSGGASVSDVRSAVEDAGLRDPNVQSLGSSAGEVIRVQAEMLSGTKAERQAAKQEVDRAIAKVTGDDVSIVSFNEVGPSWGSEISSKAFRAMIVFLVVVSIYIAVRFEWKMALATLSALVHDILVTVGVYAVFGLPVTPATVIAFLTILGYSIYDGIVVFDRVDENAKKLSASSGTTYSEMVNDSMNEVLMRTLNTSITALMPILSLLLVGSFILGATSLEEFATALGIGLLSGAYSSIFIASPVLALLKEREPRWTAVRRKVEGRSPLERQTAGKLRPSGGATAVATSTAPRGTDVLDRSDGEVDLVVDDVDADVLDDTSVAGPVPPAGPRPGVQPRPRKKGKRR